MIPAGLLLTLPEPAPALLTVRDGESVKVAVTATGPFIVTTHWPVPEQPPPDQPAKREPAAAVAVSVACVP